MIRPASYCGVAGFKPSYKLLPTIGVKCYAWSLDTVGLYGAGVADVAFATAAMSGRDLRVDRAAPGRAARRADAHAHLGGRKRRHAERDQHDGTRTGSRRREVKDIALPPLLEDAWRAHKVIILL